MKYSTNIDENNLNTTVQKYSDKYSKVTSIDKKTVSIGRLVIYF